MQRFASKQMRPFGVNIMPMGKGITERCVATCIELSVQVVTTGRADPGEAAVRKLKDAGIKVVSVIPTVAHARRMQEEGVDAVVASGCEAGGHVGTVATMPLVPQVVDAVSIPVLLQQAVSAMRAALSPPSPSAPSAFRWARASWPPPNQISMLGVAQDSSKWWRPIPSSRAQ